MALFFLPYRVSDQLLVLLPDVLSMQDVCNANVETSSSGGSEVSCSGFAVSTSNKSGGLLPVAISRGEYPLIVNCVFLAQAVIFTACRMVNTIESFIT